MRSQRPPRWRRRSVGEWVSEKPAERRLSGVGGRDRARRRRGLSPGFAFPLFSPLFRGLLRASGVPARGLAGLSASGPRASRQRRRREQGMGIEPPRRFPSRSPGAGSSSGPGVRPVGPAASRAPRTRAWGPRGLPGGRPRAGGAAAPDLVGGSEEGTRVGRAGGRCGHCTSTDPTLWAAVLGGGMLHSVGQDPLASQSAVTPIKEALRLGHPWADGISFRKKCTDYRSERPRELFPASVFRRHRGRAGTCPREIHDSHC